ncbi:integumentary mucin A.1-like [Procambarus clarkii]|uniref:integumentary mucin A.1-like n=1 Tax=Procambarus clarkii TaxID=6728 RepID=UPI0037426A5D
MRPKGLKVRATPLDGHAFGKSDILKVLKDVAGITPTDISQEGVAPGASPTASTTTPETTTRTTTRSISTQPPEPPKTRTTQTEVFPSPAPNTPTITTSAAALADVLSTNTNSTTNVPEIASTTNPRHLSLLQAARPKTKPPTPEVIDSTDEVILVGAPPPHHKYDTYSVQDLIMEATSPNSNDNTAMSTCSKSQPKKQWKI